MGKKKRVSAYELTPSFVGLDELERDAARLSSLLGEAETVMRRIRECRVTVGIDAKPCKAGRKKGKIA